MTKKLTCLVVGIALFLLPACSGQEKKTVPSGTPKVNSFSTSKPSINIPDDKSDKFQTFDTSQLPQSAVPITKAPDSKTIYYMERTDKAEKTDGKTPFIKALKGDTCQKVNLVKFSISTGKKDIIARGIPYISYAKWNKTGDMIAFCGGDRLTVYDSTKNRLLLADELKNDRVTYFGWSPDGSSIYTEHESLINGSIYDFKNGKVLHCYQTDIRLYYKGNYGDNRYFASQALDIDQEEQKKSGGMIDENRTVLTDSSGKVLKELPCGRFRDSYNNAVIQIGESGFGLQYYENMENKDFREITKEYVYDVKFTDGGYFLYTIKSDDVEKNIFMLCICDHKGNEMAQIPVSGPFVFLSPDGRTGYVSGPLEETIDFQSTLNNVDAEVDKQSRAIDRLYSSENEEEKLFKALRGAMDAYLKFHISGKKDYTAADKYYTDTKNPPQVAHFDMTRMFDERNSHFIGADFYETGIYISNMSVKSERASVVIRGSCRSSSGAASGIERALELIKKDNCWHVTGLSTFPDSQKAKDLKVKVEKIIKDMKAGSLFEGEFKGADIEIGQIQFWQMSDPTLSSDIDHSNYCKVYLKVLKDGRETMYKMVLSKEKSWAPARPAAEGLSWL